MSTYYAILTNIGVTRLANAVSSGTPLVFSHVAVGDGNGSPITPNAAMTALVHETARVSVNAVDINPDDPDSVRVEGLIPAATGGFTIREAGIYSDANELIAIASYPPIYKPTPSEGVSVDEYIRILIDYSNPTYAIALTVDPNVIVATRKYVDAGDAALQSRVDNLSGFIGSALFGDGSDGEFIADGSSSMPGATRSSTTYTLTRDVFFTTLTINTGVTVKTSGFRIYCTEELITVDATALISNSAGDCSTWHKGTATTAGTVGAGQVGRDGATTGTTNGVSSSNSIGGSGGAGGNVGVSSGGTAGAASSPSAASGSVHAYSSAAFGSLLGGGSDTLLTGGGGGGAGISTDASGASAGAGAPAGGVIAIAARVLNLASASCLKTAGGKGGDANSPINGGTGLSGGGGGGGGGILLAYVDKGTTTFSPSTNCPGGTGGTGTGVGGANGATGSNGTIVEIDLGLSETGSDVTAHTESGWSAITSGSGNTHEFLDIVFGSPFTAATGNDGYIVDAQISLTSSGDPAVTWDIVNKLTSGCRIRFSAAFNGEVRWTAK